MSFNDSKLKFSNTLIISPKILPNTDKAFSLAEVMIVIVVIGVIAALTIPSLTNKQNDTINRTKIQKALATYKTMLNTIVVDEHIDSNVDLQNYLTASNCDNIAEKLRYAKREGCLFKMPDNLYWQFPTNVDNSDDGRTYAIIGFNPETVSAFNNAVTYKNYTASASDPVFAATAYFQDDTFHVNDEIAYNNVANQNHAVNYITNADNIDYSKKTVYSANAASTNTAPDPTSTTTSTTTTTNSDTNNDNNSSSGNNTSSNNESSVTTGNTGKPKPEKPTLSTNPAVNAR